jgi:Predicted membrane protein/domain
MSDTDTNFNLNNQQVVNQQNPYQQYYQEYSPNFNPSPGVFVQSGNVEYAGFGIRLLAWLIDSLVLLFLSFITALIFGFFIAIAFLLIDLSIVSADSSIVTFLTNFISGFVGFSVNLLYFTLFWSSKFQGTPGKILLGLKIVDANGNKISYSKALIRYISTLLSSLLLGIGYLLIIFDGKKQALHDKLASTYVIKVKK